jgi:hypothetical protein
MMRSSLLVCGHPRRAGAGVGWVAVLLLFLLNNHDVLSISTSTNIDNLSEILNEDHRNLASTTDQIKAEIWGLQMEINDQTEKFAKRLDRLDDVIKVDLTAAKAIFLGCKSTNRVCMSRGTNKLMKVHNKLQKKVKFIKGKREKVLNKLQKSVDTKNQQLGNLQMQNQLPTEGENHIMDADCKIYGLTDEALPEHAHEWNELIDAFEAIVNLGYVDTGSDRIYLVDDKDLPNRNLRRRPRFTRLTSGVCRGCRGANIGLPPSDGENTPPPEESGDFVKFVNEYMSRVVTGIVSPDHVAQEIEVSCMFNVTITQ